MLPRVRLETCSCVHPLQLYTSQVDLQRFDFDPSTGTIKLRSGPHGTGGTRMASTHGTGGTRMASTHTLATAAEAPQGEAVGGQVNPNMVSPALCVTVGRDNDPDSGTKVSE